MGTAVPAVIFGPNGVIVPAQSAVLNGVIADFQSAFDGQLNLSLSNPSSLSTPQGQLASSEAAVIGQANETFLYQSTQTDPAYAEGRWQDAIGRIYFIERYPALPTVLQIVCYGATNLPIPLNASIQDTAGNIYTCTTAGTITSGGNVTLPFACTTTGPTAIPGTNDVSIYQAIPGWDSVTVASGVLGNVVESRSAFETRRAETVSGNSFGAIGSIIGAVSEVSGIEDYWGYDNGSSSPAVVQGVTVNANSIYISAAGGTNLAIAQAILSKKAPGCGYTGNTTVTAYDSNPLYASPVPYLVTFEIPAALQIIFAVNIVAGPLVPSNAATLVQNAIINAFAGGDGAPRARIGGTILATRFIAPIAALGTWAQVRSIYIGSVNTASSTFTGVIGPSSTALVISSITGTVADGQTVIDATGNVIAGTVIQSGSGTSWVVNISQSVLSEPMSGVFANQNSISVNANQIPEVVAPNIAVTVS
jgi:hypothetical protein